MEPPRSILITGGSGTLGEALISFLLGRPGVERVVCYSRGEHRQAALAARHPDRRMRWMIGDVRDRDRLARAMWGCDTVVSCAALKRVDVVAHDPFEALQTNAVGTQRVLEAALDSDVDHVLVVSTDKAVRSLNLYGATKHIAEQLAINANVYGCARGMLSSVVRYGNVALSQGSVLLTWRDQLARGLPLSVTDRSMTRFWLTVQDACWCIWRALGKMRGGEIFVPRVFAASIGDMARALAPEAAIVETGVRPGGEKRHEELMAPEESCRAFWDGADYVVPPDLMPWSGRPWPEPTHLGGFEYRSDTWPWRPSVPELSAWLSVSVFHGATGVVRVGHEAPNLP